MNSDDPKQLEIASFAAHSTRGLIRDPKTRRAMMLASLVAALLLLFVGLNIDAREHLLIAVLCWLACGWVTVLALLLALFDLLMIRRAARASQRELQQQLPTRSQDNAD